LNCAVTGGKGSPETGYKRRVPPVIYPYTGPLPAESGEWFNGDYVTYQINGAEYRNIYGLTLSTKKEEGTKTELWIKRILEHGGDLPDLIAGW
jgi:hypothetical protein